MSNPVSNLETSATYFDTQSWKCPSFSKENKKTPGSMGKIIIMSRSEAKIARVATGITLCFPLLLPPPHCVSEVSLHVSNVSDARFWRIVYLHVQAATAARESRDSNCFAEYVASTVVGFRWLQTHYHLPKENRCNIEG